MFSNYFKIAWRNIVKSKGFSVINIVGLAAGITCFLLISLYVLDELSYDRFYKNADRIYRVNSFIKFGGNELNLAVCSDPMGATLKKDYPQVEEFTRIYTYNSAYMKKGAEYINETRVANVDSTFFAVFSLPAIEGDTKTALDLPNTVVINESTAKKYFGSAQAAIGKTMERGVKDPELYKVTAVIKDIPRNSHFNFDLLFSMDNVEYGFGNFLSHNFYTYIVLKPGTDPKAFQKNLDEVTRKYALAQAQQFIKVESLEDFEKSGNRLKYELMPIQKIHLYSALYPELGVNGNIQYVYIFSAIALFTLLIACINFMNLSTARSANRAKEVGIRKVLGTNRGTLIRQFLAESTLTAFIAMLFSIVIVYLVLPLFNSLSAKQLLYSDLINWKFLLVAICLPLLVGVLSGSYPAFFLSRFKPIAVLKGKIAKGAKGSSLRSGLVVFQFGISIVLIIGTIVVYRQLSFIQNTNIGFNKDQVLVVDGLGPMSNPQAFKNEVLQVRGAVEATLTTYLPVENSNRSDNSFSTSPVMSTTNAISMQNWVVDENYISTMGMELVKGRNFSKDFGSDSTAIIINEKTAELIGSDDPIGKKLYEGNPNDPNDWRSYTIIGVVKNFNFESLHKNIGPLSLILGNNANGAAFRVQTADLSDLVAKVERIWKSMAPGIPFSYRFLDESFDEMYRDEQRIGKVVFMFSIIAIIIGCLGLFGLSTFIAEQRTKEIGIRKVLGASVGNLVGMLSKDFLWMILIAFVIAVPIAWYVMNSWISDFAYRTQLSWWIFAVAGLAALSIALITVSFQAIKAALMNPTKSLRTE